MEHSPYGLSVTLPVSFDTAVTDTTAALKAEGFGVLTSIDVQQTLKTKLNRDFRKYVILGACNPALADRALHAELEIGLLLPCNVIVYETASERSVVAAMAPLVAARDRGRQSRATGSRKGGGRAPAASVGRARSGGLEVKDRSERKGSAC
jgi:uncharacterized protein (DUF302 family)